MAPDQFGAPTEAPQSLPQLDEQLYKPHDTRDEIYEAAHSKQSNTLCVSRYLGDGKEKEWNAVANRKRPLTLLELPFDILNMIVKEITHTNDLASLALTNVQLHELAMTNIYGRFDIVWPDGNVSSSESKGVDALTYGLGTLVLGSMFARTTRRFTSPTTAPSRFQQDNYAKYTRKFSLGNGPEDCVTEYMLTKESGKMLGTLVALALAKMDNLETFVWDMPTGVLSDIFMSLASLDEPHRDCKLDRVWIRWHDNTDGAVLNPGGANNNTQPLTSSVPSGSTVTPVGILLPSHARHPPPKPPVSYAEYHVEYPTFSVLPPLKSLTVLDIDELAYLDEMAMLLERSKDRLQELRVGISTRATARDFVQPWDGPTLRQVDHKARWPGESTIGERRLGGILGVLVGRIYDIRRKRPGKAGGADPSASGSSASLAVAADPASMPGSPAVESLDSPSGFGRKGPKAPVSAKSKTGKSSSSARKRLDGKLRLQTLELERVPLSMQVCRHAIDWSVLTNLTLLECAQSETLWKMLRKQFQPTPMSSGFGISSTSRILGDAPMQYHVVLKRIHTDHTSPTLMAFIKETLAPNSLVTLFLQDRRRSPQGPPPVSIDSIFKSAIKRHRSSLRQLLLDSSQRVSTEGTPRWRHWVLTTEMVEYITSGRMSNLRELAAALAYKDWHTFLQRLPNVAQLRSIYIPHVADHVLCPFEPKELAMQIADIITLCPQIKLCYAGISTKCFEFLEAQHGDNNLTAGQVTSLAGGHPSAASPHGGFTDWTTSDQEDDDEDDDDEVEAEDTSDEEVIEFPIDVGTGVGVEDTLINPSDPEETQSDNNGEDDVSDDDSDDGFVDPSEGRLKLRVREILFYDDKVSIFKARHGKL